MITLMFEVLQEGGSLRELPRKVVCEHRLHLNWTAADSQILAAMCSQSSRMHLQVGVVPESSQSVSDGGALVLAATLPWVWSLPSNASPFLKPTCNIALECV
jgi:hypothetical protein